MPEREHVFVVDGDQVVTLYTEAIDLTQLGTYERVVRASHVEYDNQRHGWTVTFPDGSALVRTLLGELIRVGAVAVERVYPLAVFPSRQAALDAEVAEIQAHLGDAQACPIPEA
jgi:hypothetical protein